MADAEDDEGRPGEVAAPYPGQRRGPPVGGALRGLARRVEFAEAPDASNVAFATLLAQLISWRFQLGGLPELDRAPGTFRRRVEWPRPRFLAARKCALRLPDPPGPVDPRGRPGGGPGYFLSTKLILACVFPSSSPIIALTVLLPSSLVAVRMTECLPSASMAVFETFSPAPPSFSS
jgi:hypothetical protein